MMLVTAKGQSIRFKESDIREMGRGASGVKAMRLRKGDYVVGTGIIKKNAKNLQSGKEGGSELLVIMEKGYGKKTKLAEYKTQKRGGSGIKTAKITPKTGSLCAAHVVVSPDEEVVAISKKSQVIRTDVKEIATLGRQTQGVRIMKLREGDSIASLTCL